MQYQFKEIKVRDLVELINKDRIDLNPDYQRNFIWSSKDQSDLIDTILKLYPLPNFFMYQKPDGNFEMVDGQQRSKTIYRFIKGDIKSSKDSGQLFFKDCNQEKILDYKLPFVLITHLDQEDSLKDFYVLINKKGKHLNQPEVHKSEFFDKKVMRLANEVLDYQNFIDLNLFTDASSKRMNDRAFVEELLAYLKFGITDKKKSVIQLFKEDIEDEEYNVLKNKFYKVIDKLSKWNNHHELKKTRYKQKNDFFTLFNYLNENPDIEGDLLNYQYEILLILDRSDEEGRPFIRPTNGNCQALKEYATNCVSQSNSKEARKQRLNFFNAVLKNKDISENIILTDILNYLSTVFDPEQINIKKVNGFELIDVELIKKSFA